MFNSKLDVEVLKVEPYSDEKKGSGIKLHCRIETDNRKIFDDMDFAGKEDGLSRILSDELPIKATGVVLLFVRPLLELEFGGSKHIPVELSDVLTGPMQKGKVIAELKLDIKRLDKEIAGELSSNMKNIVEIKLRKVQEDMFPKSK
jgi:hypothetical protein